MILPVGHEGSGVRRLPWVTFAIIFINIIVFLFTNSADKAIQKNLKDASIKVITYYVNHPYLKFNFFGPENIGLEDKDEEIEKWANLNSNVEVPDMDTLDEEQVYLDLLISKLKNLKSSHPFWKYGLISTDRTLPSLLFHFFLHSGWLHLLSNLFFLYIMGPFLEDVWGRPLYAAFYILSGVISGFMYTIHYPEFTGPLVGASGAISGVISAFLVRYWKVRIKFVYWVYFFIGTFTAPAWMMLIFEITRELFYAYMNDSMASSGSGVAYWAHFWGLAFGISAALIIKKLNIEEKFIAPVIDDELKFVDRDFEIFEHARDLKENGQIEAAFDELKSISGASGKLPEIGEEMWTIGMMIGREAEAAPVLLRSIESEIMRDRTERALVNYLQLKTHFPDTELKDLSMKLRLLKRMIVEEDGHRAEDFLMEILNEINSDSPSGLMIDACNVFWEFDKMFKTKVSVPVLRRALNHPDIPEDRKAKIRKALTSFSAV